MTHTRRIFGLIALILWCFGSVRADQLDAFIRETIAKRKIPGVSVAVIRNGNVIRASSYGYANLETRTPAGTDTVYEIGSISKQFAAEAIMLLAEDGRLRVDEPINKYLPENAPATWSAISIRHLLNHTSGLRDWTELKEFSYRREYSPAEFIDLVKGFPLQFSPGQDWRYSNTNLPLIGVIVERASGRSFEDFVTSRIIGPLGLRTIRFKRPGEIVPNRASGYVLRGELLQSGEPFRPTVIAPSGGVLASAVDLAKWWEAVLKGRVVTQKSLNEMLSPVTLADGRSVAHGYAFFIDTFAGHKMIQHFGSTVGGFGSIVRHYPQDGLTLAVIGNLEDGGIGAEHIAKRVAGFYIPGAFVAGMKGSRETAPNQTHDHLQILRDIAENKAPEILSSNYAAKIPEPFRTQLRADLPRMKAFTFLAEEVYTREHFMLDATAAKVFHYRMVLPTRNIYFHFRINKERKIGWISSEE